MGRGPLGRAAGLLRPLAEAVVPEARELGPREWREVQGIVESTLAERPPALRRRLRLFLHLLRWLPLLRYGRTFPRLGPGEARRFLASLQDSRLLLVRRGFWGVRTLILMGYYGREGAAAEIGYRARAQGWAARREPGGEAG